MRPGQAGRLASQQPVIFFMLIMSILCTIITMGILNIDWLFYRVESNISGYEEYHKSSSFAVGYPALWDTVRVNSVEDILQGNSNFTIELSSADLYPTGYYENLLQPAMRWGSAWDAFCARLEGEAVGQYYIAELASGERIVIYLDEKALFLIGSKIILPIGRHAGYSISKMKEEWVEKYDLSENTWLVDMAGFEWRRSETARKIQGIREALFVISFIAYMVMWYKILVKWNEWLLKRVQGS